VGVFRLSCEAGLGDFTADPPKDGSATIFKAEAPFDVAQDRLRPRSKEFLIKKILRSLGTQCLCGEFIEPRGPKDK
jgi:hypothetical protein